jgi:hypothetical protein
MKKKGLILGGGILGVLALIGILIIGSGRRSRTGYFEMERRS